ENTGAEGDWAPYPAPGGVPGAVLTSAAGEVDGAVGTRCWGGMCIDMVGPVTQEAPHDVDAGETVSVEFGHGTPDEATYTWMRATDPPPAAANGERSWSGLFPPVTEAAGTGLEAPDEPGDYVLIVFAVWQGEGDVSYGFYLRVG
ncbi:MAG TPA: hypothetical protein VFK32_10520, partial [Tepidiformaceae bacterium]|nr:hypothetical protein [Tepidiformaceae bacterium]